MAALDYNDIIDLFFACGLQNKQDAARYLQVNVTTVTRWRRGEAQPPFAVFELLRMVAGHVPRLSRRQCFAGWVFQEDYIYSPEGDRFTEGDIRGIRILYDQAAGYRREIRDLQREIDRLNSELLDITPPGKAVSDSNVIKFPTSKRA